MNQKIWKKFPRVMHYTDFSTFEKIIRSKSLRFTHYKSLNDDKELEYLNSIIRKYKWDLIVIAYKAKKEELPSKECREEIIKSISGRDYPAYCASFCGEKDEFYLQNGRLSQWRGYGKEEPIAIIFDTEELYDSIKKKAEDINSEVYGGISYGIGFPTIGRIDKDKNSIIYVDVYDEVKYHTGSDELENILKDEIAAYSIDFAHRFQ